MPLDDPKLAEHARRLADFASEHNGEGHELRMVSAGKRGQTIACGCGGIRDDASGGMPLALMEDELIDDG
ncbi:MAG: hypothetical protein WEB52_13510 [Dehalococcoidia bacterium]